MAASRLDALLGEQAGVVSRRQVLAAGFGNRFIEQRLRRRDWAPVHRGVYVDHTGPLTWDQRAWAAVLFYWPAALSHESALTVAGVRTTAVPRSRGTTGQGRSAAVADAIHVAVDQRRRVDPCRTAGLVGRMLRARGWTGQLRECGQACTADEGGLSRNSPENPPSLA